MPGKAVLTARALLASLTPLKGDCGAYCGAVCCAARPGEEESGMLLFPGEEALYRDQQGFRLIPAAQGQLLVCEGRCSRDSRPLSCRLFPLLPLLREGGVRVAMDERARGVCPLAVQGVRALDPAFVEAVRAAGEALAADADQRAFLTALTREQDSWRFFRRELGV